MVSGLLLFMNESIRYLTISQSVSMFICWIAKILKEPLSTLQLEDRSDRLALELLAPETEVRCRVNKSLLPNECNKLIDSTSKVLIEQFGLPSGIAHVCGSIIPQPRKQSVSEWLRQREQYVELFRYAGLEENE